MPFYGKTPIIFDEPPHLCSYVRIIEYTNVMPLAEPTSAELLRRFKAEVFTALGHPTRIHIVESLREGELTVGAIIEKVGIEPANASQHLSVLRAKRLVVNRKEGNQVFYSLRDPLLTEVLDRMKAYFQAHLEEALQTLSEIERGPAK